MGSVTDIVSRIPSRITPLWVKRALGRGPERWVLTHYDFVLLLIRERRLRTCAEVGVWKGDLSKQVLNSGLVCKYYMVDPWKAEFNQFEYASALAPDSSMMPKGSYICTMGQGTVLTQPELEAVYEELRSEVRQFGDKAQLLRMPSVEAARGIPDNSLDFVFIDGIHLYENVKQDIETWIPKVKYHGIIAGHDYHKKQWPGVVAAVEEFFPSSILRVHSPSTVWFVNKSDFVLKTSWWARRAFARVFGSFYRRLAVNAHGAC
jgi:hypothetical protein